MSGKKKKFRVSPQDRLVIAEFHNVMRRLMKECGADHVMLEISFLEDLGFFDGQLFAHMGDFCVDRDWEGKSGRRAASNIAMALTGIADEKLHQKKEGE